MNTAKQNPLLGTTRNDTPQILLVDDTPEHIEALLPVLYENNFHVRVASKGTTALKLIEKHPTDLILLDVHMPEMDGFKVCQAIKGSKTFGHIPIIFLTSSNDEESIKKGFELGAQDYVVKPFHTSELLARVHTHIKLKQQTESLQEANKELDNFCYTVAHDLKAPLLSINKLIEYLREDYKEKLDENGQELIATIREKSTEVIAIVAHLLEYSKMCEIQMQKQKICLESLFYEVYKELTQEMSERQISFQCSSLPIIYGDPVMMKILVGNILSNALKYTRNRDLTMIEVTSLVNDSNYTIAIKDNGAGFDMSYSKRLFGVFQRLHSSSEFEGSGVGLAICQRILKRHGGKAWMKGEVDKGATFYFTFPK